MLSGRVARCSGVEGGGGDPGTDDMNLAAFVDAVIVFRCEITAGRKLGGKERSEKRLRAI